MPSVHPNRSATLRVPLTVPLTLLCCISCVVFSLATPVAADDGLRVAVFQADATPPIGSPVAYAPARKIEDPLSARGIVLLGAGEPIVLCAVDWIGIGNGGHDAWRRALAEAAGTTPGRVTVHTLHQHDGVRCDFDQVELLGEKAKARFDADFARKTIAATAEAVRESLKNARPVTHLGTGAAKVEKVASNRRILGPNGKVVMGRMSSCRNPKAVAAPEGVIDPVLRILSLWDGDEPIVCLSYYATHPQSHYGKGDVTCEFVGLARAARETALSGLPHIHFNGAGGNIAAGKYNDGSPERRPILAGRMEEGMRKAWEATEKTPITADDVEWRVEPVALPPAKHLVLEDLREQLEKAKPGDIKAASRVAFLERIESGHRIELSCLKMKNAHILHMPGELFVEYQLAAQKMKPDAFVCMAAYGDYGPSYIGTKIAYSQGGYETSRRASNVAPEVEEVIMHGMRALLEKK